MSSLFARAVGLLATLAATGAVGLVAAAPAEAGGRRSYDETYVETITKMVFSNLDPQGRDQVGTRRDYTTALSDPKDGAAEGTVTGYCVILWPGPTEGHFTSYCSETVALTRGSVFTWGLVDTGKVPAREVMTINAVGVSGEYRHLRGTRSFWLVQEPVLWGGRVALRR
ncbi:hypothetical protein WEI85_09350 [Actinomycetes bacterium KLBMP 9797]